MGDVFLIRGERRGFFIAGLAAFGILIYRIPKPGLGDVKVPVALYTVVILSMALAALLRVHSVSCLPFWLPLLGALSSIATDTLLAYQQFRRPITSGRTLVAVTYVGAQTLIVLGYLLTERLRTR